MYSQTETNKSISIFSDIIRQIEDRINGAERILIGVGSGLSAAGGLNYTDPSLVKKWYPEFYKKGFRSIVELQSQFWQIERSKPELYWGFWAQHIYHIRYEAVVLQSYMDLFEIVKNKSYFICSTNADGQIEKAGFPKEMVYAPQGDYAYFQCQKPCSDEIYENKSLVEAMIFHMPNAFEIRTEDIPICPHCGAHLIPNLRCDDHFVETPHIANINHYKTFIDDSVDKNLVLLELGVGFNTPGIIRYPFERITAALPNATLIRINNNSANVPKSISHKSISLECDLSFALDKFRRMEL